MVKRVEKVVFETADGVTFSSEKDALLHERKTMMERVLNSLSFIAWDDTSPEELALALARDGYLIEHHPVRVP